MFNILTSYLVKAKTNEDANYPSRRCGNVDSTQANLHNVKVLHIATANVGRLTVQNNVPVNY